MNRHVHLLATAQGLLLTNNIVFIAINGLVGMQMAPRPWMATLPVMGYVVGGALATGAVARVQRRWGRQASFQSGLAVALGSALLCALAAWIGSFWLLLAATVVAGYYSANGQLYRFAAAELAPPADRERAVSRVLAGGLIGAVAGPNLASHTRDLLPVPFLGAYLALAAVALLSMAVMAMIRFPAVAPMPAGAPQGRSTAELLREPTFLVAALAAAIGYGVMNLLMAATPLAMDVCGMPFSDVAWVLEWHVIGMFAPGFWTGGWIRRFGVMRVMAVGVLLNLACVAVALTGQDLHRFVVALFLLGVGWNFLFTGSTTLAMQAYRPEEKDRAQAAINFGVFATMALTSFASGALVTTQGWSVLNLGSLPALLVMGVALAWLARRPGLSRTPAPPRP
ncbi:MFS permease family protein [Sphaerotilus natans subsp. natans DSM 6575]|jgi:predicted MFS family arabinose efflux permease|uniref:MFS permease family protein n=1 Tax=Sphaerotilus natans subsp. natans DSM 6575 TaxID=1286631 RepID=A0A059KIV1_9BURK|nr:MFS transporter [Sphaerotilus natans]KDB51376.1 MFS permease family protein [Sphaerotilus natans subsp. natans DSM 6575]SIQ17260.1 Predicted arabinose efflux permease, MFS family [Sphaerotilus natans]